MAHLSYKAKYSLCHILGLIGRATIDMPMLSANKAPVMVMVIQRMLKACLLLW